MGKPQTDLETDAVENVDDSDEEVVHEETPPTEMNGRLENLEQNQAVLQILADPDVQRLIQARRAGKSVRVVDAEEADDDESVKTNEVEEPDPLEDVPADDPIRPHLERVNKLVDRKLDAKVGRIEEIARSLVSRLDGVEEHSRAQQSKEVKSQIQTVRSQYPDFDQFRDQMVALSKQNPGLDVRELYLLSKVRAGKITIPKPSTNSERPTHVTGKVKSGGGNPPKRPPGRRGFSQVLGDALASLEIEQE